jgi:hypothetical protein
MLLVAIPVPHEGPGDRAGDASACGRAGQIDFSVVKGWVTPKEWLYPLSTAVEN